MSLDMAEDPRVLLRQREKVAVVLDEGTVRDMNGDLTIPSLDIQLAAIGLFGTLTARLYVAYGWVDKDWLRP